jgi:glycerol kinase
MAKIIALDQGTSSSRTILFDSEFKTLKTSSKELNLIQPKPGWVEQIPQEILTSQLDSFNDVLAWNNKTDIDALGITNQRETTILWDRKTGRPVYNAIVWQDNRTADFCKKLKDEGYSEVIQKKTGLIINPYFSATKIAWILEHVPGAWVKAEKGDLLFGTVDTWLIWNLTGRKKHATDVTNASRTLLFNINTLSWDKDLLELFNIPECILPHVLSSAESFGKTKEGYEIFGVAGDQQAALFGQQCYDEGMVKNTYGTGCFMLMNVGNKPVFSDHGLLTTLAWKINNKVTYALEGSVFFAGSVIKWLKNNLELFHQSSDSEKMALAVSNTGNVYFVPAFTGLGTPYWDPNASGLITGITQFTNKNHMVRAGLESIAYQIKDVLDAMVKDSGIKLEHMKVDGGAAENNFLMQFQSDILGKEIIKPKNIESTALGAAMLASIGSGIKKIEDITLKEEELEIFVPDFSDIERAKLLRGWKKAIEKSRL